MFEIEEDERRKSRRSRAYICADLGLLLCMGCTLGVVHHSSSPLLGWTVQISFCTHDNERFGYKGVEVKSGSFIRATDGSDNEQHVLCIPTASF